MMQKTCLLIVVVCTIGFCFPATADEGLSLQDVVKRFAESRHRIKSYDVSISASVEEPVKPVRLSNGEFYTPTETLVAFTMDIVVDVEKGKLLVARLDRLENVASGNRENQEWRVWMTTARQTADQVYGQGRVLSGGSKPKFFDPLALGLGLGGEYRRGDPLETIVQNYSAWQPWKAERTEEGNLQFGSKEAVYLQFDPSQDYSPIELHAKNGNSGPFKVNLGLSKIEGSWLPTTGDVVNGDQKQHLRFTWHSVNDSVEHRFTWDDLAKRYQVNTTKPF